MKTRIRYIVYSILLLMVSLSGCSDSEGILTPEPTDAVKRIPVTLHTTVPLSELPSGRAAITDDSTINNYTIWVFFDGKFVEAIPKGATYNEDEITYPMVSLKENGNLYILLRESLTNVTLAMIANVDNVAPPQVGASIANVEIPFNVSNISYMPMYGKNREPFDVALGVDGGTITLVRAMAKVEVQTSGASDHFKLEEMYVYHTNAGGTVNAITPIVNDASQTEQVQGTVYANAGYVYLPEIDLKNQETKSFVIIKGLYKNETTPRYYKLDFIQQVESSTVITYQALESIKRNYRYIFDIQYLTDGTGYEILDDAISNVACNIVPEGQVQLITIKDDNIMDITTNNYIYLGITAGEVETTEGTNYYVANVSIVTNSSDGWKFEELPEGVSVSISEYKPVVGTSEEVISVWIFLRKDKYKSKDSVTLYVYGNNIRKSITVTVS